MNGMRTHKVGPSWKLWVTCLKGAILLNAHKHCQKSQAKLVGKMYEQQSFLKKTFLKIEHVSGPQLKKIPVQKWLTALSWGCDILEQQCFQNRLFSFRSCIEEFLWTRTNFLQEIGKQTHSFWCFHSHLKECFTVICWKERCQEPGVLTVYT